PAHGLNHDVRRRCFMALNLPHYPVGGYLPPDAQPGSGNVRPPEADRAGVSPGVTRRQLILGMALSVVISVWLTLLLQHLWRSPEEVFMDQVTGRWERIKAFLKHKGSELSDFDCKIDGERYGHRASGEFNYPKATIRMSFSVKHPDEKLRGSSAL